VCSPRTLSLEGDRLMVPRESNGAELELLWSAVTDGDYFEDASDGRRRWAFLFDFHRQGAAAIFPGLVGAIVYAEDAVGPTGAWFYSSSADLAVAWQNAFVSRPTDRDDRRDE
jgi:hypothetical protein